MATRRRAVPVVPVDEPAPITVRSGEYVPVERPAPIPDPRDAEIARLRAEVERLTRWMDAMARRV